MSPLNFLVNCIILAAGFRGIFAVPAAITEQFASSTALPARSEEDGRVKCPCAKTADAADHPWDQLHTRNVMVHGMVCACNLGMRGSPIRDDYRYTPGIGSHKLHTRAAVWNDARKLCIEEGGHLAIINSIVEAHILMDIFNRSGPVKGATYPNEAFLGIHDLYSEGDWVTVLGDSLAKTGYTEWSDKWGGQPDNGGGKQNCGALMKEGALDDVACNVAFPFFCELPAMQLLQPRRR